MKRVLIGMLMMVLGMASYFITFSALYESWIPYYYEEYYAHWFLAGLAIVAIAPFLIARIKQYSSSPIGNYQAVLVVNLAVLTICIATFMYMLLNSVYIGGSDAQIYQVVPASE